MKMKNILSKIITECLENLDKGNYDELAPAIIADERLSSDQMEKLEETEEIFKLWDFIEAFFDAASHLFPEVCDGLSLITARKAVEEIALLFSEKIDSLSETTINSINIFNSQN